MKNFIRGMGVGILVTTIVLGISYMLIQDKIPDDEIIQRAKKLGMVEQDQTVVRDQPQSESGQAADITTETPPTDGQTNEAQPQQDTNQPADGQNGNNSEGQQPEETPAQPAPAVPDDGSAAQGMAPPQSEDSSVQYATVQINRGDDGVTVSQKLQQNGIITDAQDFNAFLSANRLQGNIRQGSFQLQKNMDYQSIVNQIIWR